MNLLEKFNKKTLETLTSGKEIPVFKSGDTIKVHLKIIEGVTERIQIFEGLCIARRSRGLHSTFKIRKISNGEGVERNLRLYSPRIDKIELVRKGQVRRAKLYYMRDLRGKAARISEKVDYIRLNRIAAEKAAAVAAAAKPAAAQE